MAEEQKIPVSQLPEATSFEGLYALGVDNTNSSVKISLEGVGKAAGDAEEATQEAKRVAEDLQRAKESGEFNGKNGEDGKTPVKGVDYFDGKDGGIVLPFFSMNPVTGLLTISGGGVNRFGFNYKTGRLTIKIQ